MRVKACIYTDAGKSRKVNQDSVLVKVANSEKLGRISFVAVCDGKYLGMISLREKIHISLLFVDGDYHCNGIGRALIKFVAEYVLTEEGVDRLTVNSSPYAIDFYHRLGFRDTHKETVADGIKFTPMELRL